MTPEIISIVIYKLACLFTGTLLSYFGFILFKEGIVSKAGDAEGEIGGNKLIVRNAAPGTFFVILGAIIICFTVFKGLNFENIVKIQNEPETKPLLID